VRSLLLVGTMDHEAESPATNVNNDVNLVSRAQAGDEAAWSAIVELHWKQVWALSRIIVRDQQGAEEVALDTFRAVRDRLGAFAVDRTLCEWIQSVCRQRALDELRRRSRQADQAAAAAAPPWRSGLEQALVALEAEEREALLLTAAGSAADELARALDTEAGTIRARVARARARLVEHVDGSLPR
jgi:RNA polymerase sigma-70 factor (ECF subfamily)